MTKPNEIRFQGRTFDLTFDTDTASWEVFVRVSDTDSVLVENLGGWLTESQARSKALGAIRIYSYQNR